MAFKGTRVLQGALSKAYGWGSFIGKLNSPVSKVESLHLSESSRQVFSTPQPLSPGSSEKSVYSHIAAGYQHGFISFNEANGSSKLCSFGLNTSGQLGFGRPGDYECGVVSDFSGKEITEIQCGREHTLVRTKDSVYGCGNTNYGQLGLGRSKDRLPEDEPVGRLMETSFQNLSLKFPVKQMACGLDHSVLLADSGVFTMGWGADGQLGLGLEPPANHDTPMPIPIQFSPKDIKKLSSSHDCTLVLLESGKVYSWGNSEYGQGMHGKKIDRVLEASPIAFQEKVVDVASGGSFSLLLSESGKVFVCGYGVLGLGSNVTEVLIPTEIPELKDIKSIFASSGSACAINNNGEVFIWGLGSPASYRLGLGTECTHVHSPRLLQLPYDKLKVETVALGGHFGLLLGSD